MPPTILIKKHPHGIMVPPPCFSTCSLLCWQERSILTEPKSFSLFFSFFSTLTAELHTYLLFFFFFTRLIKPLCTHGPLFLLTIIANNYAFAQSSFPTPFLAKNECLQWPIICILEPCLHHKHKDIKMKVTAEKECNFTWRKTEKRKWNLLFLAFQHWIYQKKINCQMEISRKSKRLWKGHQLKQGYHQRYGDKKQEKVLFVFMHHLYSSVPLRSLLWSFETSWWWPLPSLSPGLLLRWLSFRLFHYFLSFIHGSCFLWLLFQFNSFH